MDPILSSAVIQLAHSFRELASYVDRRVAENTLDISDWQQNQAFLLVKEFRSSPTLATLDYQQAATLHALPTSSFNQMQPIPSLWGPGPGSNNQFGVPQSLPTQKALSTNLATVQAQAQTQQQQQQMPTLVSPTMPLKLQEKYEQIAKQDLAQCLTIEVRYDDTSLPNNEFQTKIYLPNGELISEYTGSSKKKSKTFAAIMACQNEVLLPYLLLNKRLYWLETYFPDKNIDPTSIPFSEKDGPKPSQDNEQELTARNDLYQYYNQHFHLTPEYHFEKIDDKFHCKLFIDGVLKSEADGQSKKLAGNEAAKLVIAKENIPSIKS